MPAAGRVVTTPGSHSCPSPAAGQGTSLALVGAYMLAGALGTHDDHAAAFAAYERDTRPYVEANQNLVGEGDSILFPATEEALAKRNEMLRGLTEMPAEPGRPEHSALTLPDFMPAAR